MMSYEMWLNRILDAASNIGSRDFQENAWFAGGSAVSSPNEIYLTLMEDYTFDLFFEMYGKSFTNEQVRNWEALRSRLEAYYDKLPKNPDARCVLDDPEWDIVRQSARSFVDAFPRPRE
jgi:hypothetical protein